YYASLLQITMMNTLDFNTTNSTAKHAGRFCWYVAGHYEGSFEEMLLKIFECGFALTVGAQPPLIVSIK
ncbi:MAG: hypothetical protein C0508_23750, partial [Cyanobacteria bacterium PR.023]|nr:hypothetical protein [Cyanobacteria bacterium PR.023]